MARQTSEDEDPVTRFRMSSQYQKLKSGVHRHLIAQIEERDLHIDDWSADKVSRFIAEQVRRYVVDQRLAVNQRESEVLAGDARDELIGFGPIQGLVDDPEVADIVVNGPDRIFVERAGRLQAAPVRFVDDNHVVRVIQRILSPIGRRVDESTPMVDARLPDGSRVNAIIPPIALDGPCVSIRKFREQPLTAEQLLAMGSVDRAILDYLRERVQSRTSLMVVGEVRGDEVLDMLQAMNTGHDGSMTTIHANGTRDAIHRLELLANFAGFSGSEKTLRGQLGSAVQLFVHLSRLPSGERRVMAVTELTGSAGGELQLRDRFRYDIAAGRHVDCGASA